MKFVAGFIVALTVLVGCVGDEPTTSHILGQPDEKDLPSEDASPGDSLDSSSPTNPEKDSSTTTPKDDGGVQDAGADVNSPDIACERNSNRDVNCTNGYARWWECPTNNHTPATAGIEQQCIAAGIDPGNSYYFCCK